MFWISPPVVYCGQLGQRQRVGQTKIFRGWFRLLLSCALNHVVTACTCWNLHFLTRFPVFYCGVCVCLFFSHPFFVFCFVTRSRTVHSALMGCHAVTWSSSRLKSSRSSHRIVFFFSNVWKVGRFSGGVRCFMTFLMLQLQWLIWNEGPPTPTAVSQWGSSSQWWLFENHKHDPKSMFGISLGVLTCHFFRLLGYRWL